MPYPVTIGRDDYPDGDPIEAAIPTYRVKRGLFQRAVRNTFAHPRLEITELRLRSQTTRRRSSKSYIRKQNHDPIPANSRDRFHCVPGGEAMEIVWSLKNGNEGHANAIKFEVFQRGDAAALWTQRLRWPGGSPRNGVLPFPGTLAAVAPDAHGNEVLVDFDAAHFPDAHLTMERSPYKLKMTVESNPATRPRWLYFDILPHGLELGFGPRDLLAVSPTVGTTATERDHSVHDRLLDVNADDNLGDAFPNPGQTKKVFLLSNDFYTDIDQLPKNEAFDIHRRAWGDGPNIPLLAKLALKRSDGEAVDGCPQAIGNAKLFWEWRDDSAPDKGIRPADDAIAASLDQSLDYHADDADYPGMNCHEDRGGKRGPNASPVFPAQAGYPAANPRVAQAFPFVVAAAANRPRSAVSSFWGSGDAALAGRSGVLFQPSRMGGDSYTLHLTLAPNAAVLADYDRAGAPGTGSLDEAEDELRTRSGRFEIWREVHIANYLKKHAAAGAVENGVARNADIDLAAVGADLEAAYIKLVDLSGGMAAAVQAQWNQAIHDACMNDVPWFIQSCIDSAVASDQHQHAPLVQMRDFAAAQIQFTADAAAHMGGHADIAALLAHLEANHVNPFGEVKVAGSEGNAATHAKTRAWGYYRGDKGNLIRTNVWGNAFTYESSAKTDWPRLILVHALRRYLNPFPRDGIVIVQGDTLSNLGNGGPCGFGVPFQGGVAGDEHRSLIVMVGHAYNSATPAYNRESTLSHEIGHCLGLNHPVFPQGDPRKLHQAGFGNCLMSYNKRPDGSRELCSLCLLKLRGWSFYGVNPATGLANPPANRSLWHTTECNQHPGGTPPDADWDAYFTALG